MRAPSERRFLLCAIEVLELEGWGELVRLNDGAGRTQYGVTERWRPRAWADGKVTIGEAIDELNLDWIFVRGHRLPPPVDLVLLDWAFHDGAGDAAAGLQRAVGVTVDRHIGEQTRAAVAKWAPRLLAENVCSLRLSIYDARGSEYRRAFHRRVERLLSSAAAAA